MYFSYATLVGVLLRAQQRKQNDVADGARVGEQHGEPVDADSLATRGRHPVAQGANVVLIDGVGGEISLFAQELLVLEPVALLGRVVQLAEGVSDLHAADVQLEALDKVRVVRLLLRQWRHLEREVDNESRLDEIAFRRGFK